MAAMDFVERGARRIRTDERNHRTSEPHYLKVIGFCSVSYVNNPELGTRRNFLSVAVWLSPGREGRKGVIVKGATHVWRFETLSEIAVVAARNAVQESEIVDLSPVQWGCEYDMAVNKTEKAMIVLQDAARLYAESHIPGNG